MVAVLMLLFLFFPAVDKHLIAQAADAALLSLEEIGLQAGQRQGIDALQYMVSPVCQGKKGGGQHIPGGAHGQV